ncbi:MAG: hypothetical protein LBD47_08870 [Treponema sp.]|jgi:hypothetical protein|nr:hypothetical protein [Treponema sp.]
MTEPEPSCPCAASYGKKQAGQAVKGETRPGRGKRELGKGGGRPPKYHQAFAALLTRIRKDHGRPRGKLLSPLIRGIIDFLTASKEPDYGISDETKALPVQVCGAPIDRCLHPHGRRYKSSA